MSMSPVRQPFHILLKDAIHLWPETLVSIALLVAFAWADAQTWLPSDGSFNPAVLAVVILRLLIPVSWLILTSRLVHDEELVGDRQFWTTRPYTWYSLLLSKVLFIVVFICVPFLVMQAWLLHHAGLYPTLVVPAMMKNLLYVALVFLLPLLALAAVTATFVRYISSTLGGIIYFFAILVIAAYNWPDTLEAPYLSYFLSGTLIALLVAAVLVQYAKRKTLVARLLLVALPLVVLAFAIFSPSNLLNEHRYPHNSAGAVTFDPDPSGQEPSGRLFTFQKKVIINLPVKVQLNGLPDKSVVEVQRLRATLDGPNGLHYVSNWTTVQNAFNPAQQFYKLSFRMPENVYNQIHDKPVSLHLELGTQLNNAGTPYILNATETPFPLPGHAACTVSADEGQLECRYPFSNPNYMQVDATVHSGNCLVPGPLVAKAFGGLAPSSSPVAFSPVEISHTFLAMGNNKVQLCPGTLASFTPFIPGAYGRMTVDVPSLTLDPYAQRTPVAALKPAPTPAP